MKEKALSINALMKAFALYCRVFLWTKLWYEAFTVLHYDTCVS